MLKRLENKLMMLKAVLALLKQNSETFNAVAAMAGLIAKLDALIAQIELLRQITESDNTGITAEKDAQEEALIEKAYELSSKDAFMKQIISKTIVKSICLCLTLGILVTACHNKKDIKRDPNSYYASVEKNGNHEVAIFDASKIRKKIRSPLSKFVDNCEMICLETSDASMLSELARYAVSDNYLCVGGSGMPAKLFKRDGSFICDVGRIGQGPGEYSFEPSQIKLDEKNNSIFIIPAFNVDRILHYDLAGNFVGSIPLLYKSLKARILINADTITIMSMVADEKTPIVYQQTFEGKLIQKLPVIKSLIIRGGYDNEILSSISPDYDLYITAFDTLFHYNPKQNAIEPKLVSSPIPHRFMLVLRELPDYYFGRIHVKKNECEYDRLDVMINKETFEVNLYEIVNDFYGRIPVKSLHGCSEGMFIASTPAFELMNDIKELLKENKLNAQDKQKLKNILIHLHENDNDVVFIGS